ncbi:GlsB/YeaQ/YmgE family stress response membrane protein [Paenibacillus sp. FJAT-26967]|uniref:GlsB/YeaQ/YmgE family stress response membrane protein n=1 Tax=Paenibacillus sp. FJAT-26967 TaxID=1729690 RepID=UPI000837BB90|nr:GlsB/YeaQ/YmgE family stress response membrane protein [Paenibacillus sp. FJAT-26967]
MIGLIITIIMAVVIGIIGDAIVRSNMPGGIIGSMIAGFVGAWLGYLLLGKWGPQIGGFAVIPAIIGAALFVFLIGMISRAFNRSNA